MVRQRYQLFTSRIIDDQRILESGWLQEKPVHTQARRAAFFQLLFGCPTANFGPLSRGQPHQPDVNHCILFLFDPKVSGTLVARLSPKARLST